MDSPEASRVKQFPDHIKLLCFIPEFLGQNRNNLLEKKLFWTKSKCFTFALIISGPNQNALLLF
jgi:hypothetical protein